MRPILACALSAALALLAGCPVAARNSGGSAPAVRQADPVFQANLKWYEEQRVTWHTMEKGETFYSISRKYAVPVAAIAAANPQLQQNNIAVGEKVAVPGVGPAISQPTPPDTVQQPTQPVAQPTLPFGPKPSPVKTRDRGQFCYPVVGTARDSKGPTRGVEFAAPVGATVVAGGSGRVVMASPNLGGLGPTVIVDHGNGLCTLYGRMADFAVRVDQKVGRGEPIGRCGAGGLVFRVYKGPAAQDPGAYLNRK